MAFNLTIDVLQGVCDQVVAIDAERTVLSGTIGQVMAAGRDAVNARTCGTPGEVPNDDKAGVDLLTVIANTMPVFDPDTTVGDIIDALTATVGKATAWRQIEVDGYILSHSGTDKARLATLDAERTELVADYAAAARMLSKQEGIDPLTFPALPGAPATTATTASTASTTSPAAPVGTMQFYYFNAKGQKVLKTGKANRLSTVAYQQFAEGNIGGLTTALAAHHGAPSQLTDWEGEVDYNGKICRIGWQKV